MDDGAFLESFLQGRPPGNFGHEEHLRVAWTAARLHGPEQGSELVARGLRRLGAAHGHGDRYHETITRFWLRLVEHAIDEEPGIDDFGVFLERFPLLLGGTLLGRHWSREVLAAGRADWSTPDLLPLP